MAEDFDKAEETVRVAAAGDVHLGTDSQGLLEPHLDEIDERADLFLFAGDFTMWGATSEAKVFASELEAVSVPKIGVLGNHDHESGENDAITEVLEEAGVRVLECDGLVLELKGRRIGIAGAKGFGGGFLGACASEFGEPEMKDFVRHTKDIASRFERALVSLDADLRIALLHYSPIEETLVGERLEIYPFLGSYLLGQAVDRGRADLVVHGHAHAGSPEGKTPGGVPVYNVAQQVIGRPFEVFDL